MLVSGVVFGELAEFDEGRGVAEFEGYLLLEINYDVATNLDEAVLVVVEVVFVVSVKEDVLLVRVIRPLQPTRRAVGARRRAILAVMPLVVILVLPPNQQQFRINVIKVLKRWN